MADNQELVVAVQVRSTIDARGKVEDILENLKLGTRNQCVVMENSDSVRGMLKHAKDYITYGEVDEETLEKLEEVKGEEIEAGDTFNLHPPKGGFESAKKQVGQGGSLGERKNMEGIISKMV